MESFITRRGEPDDDSNESPAPRVKHVESRYLSSTIPQKRNVNESNVSKRSKPSSELNISVIPKVSETNEIPRNIDDMMETMMLENRLLQISFMNDNIDKMIAKMEKSAEIQLVGMTILNKYQPKDHNSKIYELYENIKKNHFPIYEKLSQELSVFSRYNTDLSSRLNEYQHQISTNVPVDHLDLLNQLEKQSENLSKIHAKYEQYYDLISTMCTTIVSTAKEGLEMEKQVIEMETKLKQLVLEESTSIVDSILK